MAPSNEAYLPGVGAQFDESSAGQNESVAYNSHQGSNTNVDAVALQGNTQPRKTVVADADPTAYGYQKNDKPMIQSWYDQTARDESWTALAAVAKTGTTK